MQGSISVNDYEQYFVSLTSFVANLHLWGSTHDKMFKDMLNPSIRGMVSIQWLWKFRDVIEAKLITERN